ncbi:thioesterase II family protein [Vibrio mangrovi]|uniref:Alpha/beta fold hydrolase n=1 Tax=Vibrio mangrovi TaxID=474394 RepID=A0A1Y6ISB8_9VIBR|nr:alpha/beta fold hydrolase [Vibrio mangrovi]MDW6003280.1 alpha/beta fold hydrolase [Vibrio mangrovi]SMR99931.1 Surfactin synthase thioesterase subunit [Vibrio mangrovi]
MTTLICLPSSGSSSTLYSDWKPLLAEKNISLLCPEYPGRGQRFTDPLISGIPELVDDLMQQIQVMLPPDESYHIFGHSLGGVVAYELTLKIQQTTGFPAPQSVIISASHAPHLRGETILKSHLEEPELIALLQKMGGLKKEVLQHPELMELLLPIIRADLALNDHYHRHDIAPLSCPITTIHGLSDPIVKPENISAWERYTADYRHLDWPGDHFYFQQNLKDFLNRLSHMLAA